MPIILKRTVSMLLAVLMTILFIPSQAFCITDTVKGEEQLDLKLTYNTYPTDDELELYYTWENYGLMTGNSAIGGGVLGGVTRERIQLNDKTLWSGGPSEERSDYMGGNLEEKGQYGAVLKEVQSLFAEGKIDEAVELCSQSLLGTSSGYGMNLSYGNMFIDFNYGEDAEVTNYKKTLDLRTALITVEYDIGATHYTRTTYTSYPDNVLVTRITAEGESKLNFDVSVEPDNDIASDYLWNQSYSSDFWSRVWTTEVNDGTISVSGSIDDNQMRFASHTKVIADGTVTDGTETVSVGDSSDVTIITSIGTDYKNVYPNYRTGEDDEQVSAKVLKYVTDAAQKGYDKLTEDHISDYSELFSRVELTLDAEAPDKTTVELLDAYRDGTATQAEQRYAEILFFQMGRYLTIESSRETPEHDPERQTLPSNLQGLWVATNNTMWRADYHLNVNLQMNYMPNYVTNLAETAEPLVDFIDSLRTPGRVTAYIYAGVESTEENPENGFMVHTQNTPFGWTCPGYSFDWGWGPAGVAWIIHNIWEYYEYTGDTDYLREEIYPIMREATVFFDQYLVRDAEGYLVSTPSFSPEHGPYTNGNTYEQTIIWQLYEDTIAAAEALGVDEEKVALWKANQADLKGPVEIGDSGQIKEWYEEGKLGYLEDGSAIQDYDDDHFHISHLIGLFPGNYISTETPELLEAALYSLEQRGENASCNWGRAWRALCYARAGDGEAAHEFIQKVILDEVASHKTVGERYNGLTSGPIFQIEGSLGYTAAVAEVLMQSNAGYINLLPALSDSWSEGSVSGLVARGNFEISMDWSDGKLDTASILSKNGGTATLQYNNIAFAKVTDSKGNDVELTGISLDRVSFETEVGETYTVTEIPADAAAPENLTAERIGTSGAKLYWDAVTGENVTYNIYRRVSFGELQKIAGGVTDTEYTDIATSEKLENVKYQVSATADGEESALSDKVQLVCYAETGIVDDSDSAVIYTAGTNGVSFNKENYPEGHKYYQPELYDITCHNLNAGNSAGQTVELTFVGTGIEVIAVKGTNRGYMNASIDGEDAGVCDMYASKTTYGESALSVKDLDYGKHTLVLTAPSENTKKLQIDAFRILGGDTVLPESVTVRSRSGLTVIGSAGLSLSLEAAVLPENTTVSAVIWKSSDTSVATVDQNGTVTAVGTGNVTVTAVSAYDSTVRGSIDISVNYPEYVELIADDSVALSDELYTATGKTAPGKNGAISWSSSWRDPYTKESSVHLGGTKTETGTAGEYFEYTFTGTGVQIISQKTKNMGAFQVYIDGEDMGTYSLYTSNSAGVGQAVIYTNTGLDFGVHTVKCVTVTENGRSNWNLDAIRVYMPKNAEDGTNTYEYIQESITNSDGYTGTANPDITFSGSWSSNVGYWKEPFYHSGYRKRDGNEGAAFEYTFVGTGVQIGAQKNTSYGAYSVTIDGVDYGVHSLKGSYANQQPVFSELGLDYGTHTIKAVAVADGSNTKVNLDYICVYNYSNYPSMTDKAPLHNAVIGTQQLCEDYYTADSWAVLEGALETAIALLESDETTQQQADVALAELESAVGALGTPSVPAPETQGLSATLLHLESNRAVVMWDGAENAVRYMVEYGDKTETVSGTTIDIIGLTSNEQYTVKVYPVAEYEGVQAVSQSPIELAFTTLDNISPELPDFETEELYGSPVTLCWTPSPDGVAAYYELYIDGEKFVSDTNSLTVTGLANGYYTVVITAVDSNQNVSNPVIKKIAVANSLQIDAVSVTLKNDLTFNFKLSSVFESRAPIVTVDGKRITEYTRDGEYLVFSYDGIAPHKMTDTLSVTVTAGDESGEQQSFSVADYCYEILKAYPDDEQLCTLVTDTLNYGAAAQTYKGYKTESLANAGLSDAERVTRDAGEVTSAVFFTDDIGETAWWSSHSLYLENSIEIKLSFESDMDDLSVIVRDESGNTVATVTEIYKTPYGKNYFYFNELAAGQIDDVFSFTVMSGDTQISETLYYSASSYAVYAKGDSLPLVNAMLAYGRSAKAYANVHTS